jgi:hypothetical protein
LETEVRWIVYKMVAYTRCIHPTPNVYYVLFSVNCCRFFALVSQTMYSRECC